jgi:hypothetical protein
VLTLHTNGHRHVPVGFILGVLLCGLSSVSC